MVGLLIWKCLFEDLVWFIFNILFFFFPSSPSDFVIFFSSLWEDSSSCYHGSERQLQVQWQHSEYISRGTFSGLLLRSSVAHSGLPSLHSLTYTKTWSLGLTWIHGSPWWGPTERENRRYWSCWWERSVEPPAPPFWVYHHQFVHFRVNVFHVLPSPAPAHRRHDPQTFSRQNRQIPPGK